MLARRWCIPRSPALKAMSVVGTSRHSRRLSNSVAFGTKRTFSAAVVVTVPIQLGRTLNVPALTQCAEMLVDPEDNQDEFRKDAGEDHADSCADHGCEQHQDAGAGADHHQLERRCYARKPEQDHDAD